LACTTSAAPSNGSEVCLTVYNPNHPSNPRLDNIAAFSGDPARITFFGQSAGATSIDLHTFAWPSDPIAHAVILQSGTANDQLGVGNAVSWRRGAASLGCIDSVAVVDCVRAKSAKEVADAFANLQFGPSMEFPTVYKSYNAPLVAGKFARIPALIGHTEAEGKSYMRWSIFPQEGVPVPTTAKPAPGNVLVSPVGTANIYESTLVCRVGRIAAARAGLALPTWVYAYAGAFENQESALGKGPWHGSEVGLVFGTNPLVRKVRDNMEQAELGRKMREAWTTFAKDPEKGLTGLKWPRYNSSLGKFRYEGIKLISSGSTIITLGGKDSGNITFTSAARYTPACKFLLLLEKYFGTD
jgi:carboxylesterase type B